MGEILVYSFSAVQNIKGGFIHMRDDGTLYVDKRDFNPFDENNQPRALRQDKLFGMTRFGIGVSVTFVIINPAAQFENGRIYFVEYQGCTSVRRVTKNPDDSYTLESDYGVDAISREFAVAGEFRILGRVVMKQEQL